MEGRVLIFIDHILGLNYGGELEVSLLARVAKCIRNVFMSKIGRTIFSKEENWRYLLGREMRKIGSISHDSY